ncbi:MAG: M23 family metallopeptidase [Bacteroidales bacterium]|nr:M23 family metallopeptidase [Bacteroidales bacterium]
MNRVLAFFRGKGFYLALMACILAAALCSFWAIRTVTQQLGSKDEVLPGGDDTWNLPGESVEQKVEDVPVTEPDGLSGTEPQVSQAPSASSSTASSPSAAASESTEQAATPDSGFVQPVSGQVIAEYSGTELVYNETLGDWRTHNGVDISCADDASVKACCEGQVSAVYDDGLYGTIVEVTSGDMVYRYCGLAHDTDVKTGDTVKSGSRLGSIGKVNAEASLPTHLHFEVLRGGAYQDPMATLAG